MLLSQKLVRLLYERRRAGLPADIRHKAKFHVADTIGIAVAANGGFAVSDQVLKALGAGGARGDCQIIGGPQKLPPALAAFGNSALMHALDYDDIHDHARVHPTPVTLAAALATAQISNAPCHFVWDAVALGNELMCRLGLACSPLGKGPASNWFLTQLFGYLGAALTSSIILDLSEEEAVSALGFAYMQAAGGKEAGLGVGSTARSIYPAFAAMGGIHASLLAQAGVIGPPASLDGGVGLFQIYLGNGPTGEQRATVLAHDGWIWTDTETKPWPSCRLSHAYVAAALNIRNRLSKSPIRRVSISVNPSANNLCRPLAERCRPKTLQDAKFSIPFMTAFTLVHGEVTLNNLGAETLNDKAVLELASRIEVLENLPDNPGHPPAEIVVETDAGRVGSGIGVVGSMSPDQIRAKFFDCLKFAGLSHEAACLWDALMRMDEIGVSPIFALRQGATGAVAELVGNEGGVVSGVINLESSGVEASDWRPRHDEHYHEA